MSTYRAWAVTIRPREGLTDDMVERCIACFMKPCIDGAYVVTEKLGVERHLHAAVYFAKGVRKGQVLSRCQTIQGELDPAELRVLKSGIKICYNDDFRKNYLTKGDDTEVIMDTAPTDASAYYPSPEEQQKAMASASMGTLTLIELYRKKHDVVTLGRVLDFLRTLWFEHRSVTPPVTLQLQMSRAVNLYEMIKNDMDV